MKRYLFVGGWSDGKMIECEGYDAIVRRRDTAIMPVPTIDPSAISVDTEVYTRRVLKVEHYRLEYYALQGMSDWDAIWQVFSRYIR